MKRTPSAQRPTYMARQLWPAQRGDESHASQDEPHDLLHDVLLPIAVILESAPGYRGLSRGTATGIAARAPSSPSLCARPPAVAEPSDPTLPAIGPSGPARCRALTTTESRLTRSLRRPRWRWWQQRGR